MLYTSANSDGEEEAVGEPQVTGIRNAETADLYFLHLRRYPGENSDFYLVARSWLERGSARELALYR